MNQSSIVLNIPLSPDYKSGCYIASKETGRIGKIKKRFEDTLLIEWCDTMDRVVVSPDVSQKVIQARFNKPEITGGQGLSQ